MTHHFYLFRRITSPVQFFEKIAWGSELQPIRESLPAAGYLRPYLGPPKPIRYAPDAFLGALCGLAGLTRVADQPPWLQWNLVAPTDISGPTGYEPLLTALNIDSLSLKR